VAGFDFTVAKHPVGEGLQRGLLRLIQSDSRDLGLKFRFKTVGDEFYGVLDGPLPLMYGLRAYMGEDFWTYVGAARQPADRRQRVRIAKALLRAFDGGLKGITEMMDEVAEMMGGVPNSILFDPGPKTDLAHLLRALTRTLMLDIQGRVSKTTVVEETHTALENVLRVLTSRKLSFAEMVDVAVARDYLSNEEAADVIRLKDVRREAKHRAEPPDDDEAGRLIVAGVTALQQLLVHVRAAD
jgi:hypothetical protein